MVVRDRDRINRLVGLMEEHNLDYIVVFDEVNLRYIAGGVVDYSACILSSDGIIYLVTPPMEFERAKLVSWVDDVYMYGGDSPKSIKADSLVEAVSRMVEENVGLPFNYITHSQFNRLISSNHGFNVVDCDSLLLRARAIKTSYEVGLIKDSVSLVEDGLEYAINYISVGFSELEVARESIVYYYKAGADKVYSDLIVASGERAAYPHGRASEKVIVKGDVITLDYVASMEGYWGDVTRTVFLDSVDRELRRVYEVVESALNEAIDSIYPGVKASDVDKVARSVIEREGYGEYFLHSTGHGLGLEIHESPRLSKKSDDVLEANMVITVEPGIYIKGLGGVRIENDVLVCSDGREVLNRLSTDLLVL